MSAGADAADPGFDFAFVDALPTVRAGAAALHVALDEADAEPGPALLFIPGGYHGAWCYAGWLRACRDAGIACAALDYRGHGALAAGGLSPAAGVKDYVTDTLSAAQTFADAPVIVGHSLGGLVAMAAAMRTDTAGLALVAPSPPGNLPGARALPELDESCLKAPPSRAEAVERFLAMPDTPLVDAYMARLCAEAPRALNDRYRLAVPVDVARIAAPVLVIEAGLDCGERHPPGQDEAIARFLGGEFAHLAGAPHCMMLGRASTAALDIILAWRKRRCI